MNSAQVLRAGRIELYPVTPAHADELFALMSDPRVSEFLAWAPHQDPSETRALLVALADSHAKDKGYHWTVRHGGNAIGLISLIDLHRTHRLWMLSRAEIAYWIGVKYQGSGFATEATEAVVAFAFESLGLNRLKISHTSSNPASGRIPQKLGFEFIGTEHQFFQKNGVWFDMNHYELLADTWRGRKGAPACS